MFRKWMVVAVVPVLIALSGGLGTAVAAPQGTPAHVQVMQVFKSKSHGGGGGTTNLTFHGGAVETTPAVYIVYWGSWWNGSATTGTQNGNSYGPATAMAYVNAFFTGVGGSAWNNVDHQYCQGVVSGTINCSGAGTAIPNSASQLHATLIDTTNPVPASPTQSQIAAEAVYAAGKMGYSPSAQPGATIMVFTPSGNSMSGFGTSWCAWHSSTTINGVNLPYAYMPYVPDAGGGCGENFVNPVASATAFGNGYFDGFRLTRSRAVDGSTAGARRTVTSARGARHRGTPLSAPVRSRSSRFGPTRSLTVRCPPNGEALSR
jgi:hypothetical protein